MPFVCLKQADSRETNVRTQPVGEKDVGPASNEKSVANLRERVSLLEDILGIA